MLISKHVHMLLWLFLLGFTLTTVNIAPKQHQPFSLQNACMQKVFPSLWIKCKAVPQALTKWNNYQTHTRSAWKKDAKFVNPPTTSTGKTLEWGWLKFGKYVFFLNCWIRGWQFRNCANVFFDVGIWKM